MTLLATFESRVAALVALSVGLLACGSLTNRLMRDSAYWFDPRELAIWLEVNPGMDPWLMATSELSGTRILFNLATKGGFIDLALISFILLLVVYLGIKFIVSALWWQLQKISHLIQVTQALSKTKVRINIAGTVPIRHTAGLIYINEDNKTLEQSGHEIYSSVFINVRIDIYQVNI